MLDFNDVVGMCECTEEEIEAIAIHEHIPDVVLLLYFTYSYEENEWSTKI